MPTKQKLQLNIGCGVHLVKGFTNIDVAFSLDDLKKGIKTKEGLYQNAIIERGAKFIQADAAALPFKDGSVDYIEAADFLEHLPMVKVLTVLREMYRVLKKGGKLVIETNDFSWCAREWLALEKQEQGLEERDYFTRWSLIAMHAYGNQIGFNREKFGDAEFHKVPFSPRSLQIYLTSAGFPKDPKKLQIVLFPAGSSLPPLKTRKHSIAKNKTINCDLLFAVARK